MNLFKSFITSIRTHPLLAIIIVSLCLRVGMAIYLGDTLDSPQQERVFDQHSYDLLAHSLLAGRGYSFEQSHYPFTPAYTPTAHWSFLYPLFIAGIYAITGFHPIAVRLIQVIISSILVTILLYRLGRWLSGETVGLVTAGLGAIYSYFILFDAALMTESFFIIGIMIMFILSLKIIGLWNNQEDDLLETKHQNAPENNGIKKPIVLWILLGIDIGITAILRQTILLWAPFLFAYLFIYQYTEKFNKAVQASTNHNDKNARLKGNLTGAFVSTIVISLIILPFTIRNYSVYGTFLPLNSNAGYAFYSSNHPNQGTHFDQDYGAPIPEELSAQHLNEAQLNTQLTRLGLEYIISDPERFLLLSLNRAGIFFNFGFLADSSLANNLIRTISTGLYLPFFIIGIWLSRHNARRYLLFYLFAIIFSFIHIISWSSIRYRLPIDAVFMPFAAYAVVRIIKILPVRLKFHNTKKQTHDDLLPE